MYIYRIQMIVTSQNGMQNVTIIDIFMVSVALQKPYPEYHQTDLSNLTRWWAGFEEGLEMSTD